MILMASELVDDLCNVHVLAMKFSPGPLHMPRKKVSVVVTFLFRKVLADFTV